MTTTRPASRSLPLMPWTRSRPAMVSGWLARAILAAVFVIAALPKVQDASGFAAAIDNYHLLSPPLIRAAALGLPLLELCIALALLWNRTARGACLLAGSLLGVFALAMAQAIWRGIDLDCGCFGQSAELGVSWWSVARNVGLCALSAWGLLTTQGPTAAATLPKP